MSTCDRRACAAILISIFFFVGFASAEVFSDADRAFVSNRLKSSQLKDGSFGDLEDTYFAVLALEGHVGNVDGVVKVASAALDADASLEEIHYALAIAAAVGRPLKASADTVAKLEKAEDTKDAEDIYHAVSALAIIGDTDDLVPMLKAVLALAEDDGMFKGDSDDEDGSFEATSYALATIALITEKAHLSPEDKAAVTATFEKADDLVKLAAASGDSESLSFSDLESEDASAIATTALILSSLDDLSDNLKRNLPFGADAVQKFADFFLDNRRATEPEDAYYVAEGLEFASEHHALIITMEEDTVAIGQPDGFQVSVTDVYGKSVGPAKVVATRITPENSDKPIASNVALAPVGGSDTDYGFILSSNPEPGLYIVDIEATANDAKFGKAHESEFVKVSAPIGVTDCTLAVSDSKEEADTTDSKSYSCSTDKPAGEIAADDEQFVHLGFKIKNTASGQPFKPHQVFLRFTNKATKEEAIFVAKLEKNRHSFHVGIGVNAEAFDYASGSYLAEVLVGDALASNQLLWNLATFNIKFTTKTAPVESYPDPYKPQHEIEHIFRAPEKRTPEVVSLFFTVLVLTPLGFLLFAWAKLGVNISNFPTDSAAAISAIVFHGAVGGICVLYAVYWFQLTMFTTLGYLAVLLVVALLAGQRFLSYKAQQRAAHVKKE